MKKNTIFYVLSSIILVAAMIFVFVGSRVSGPEIDLYPFSIPVTYEENGVVKTETVIYYGQYWEETQSFHGFYENSGMPDTVNMLEKNGNPIWWLELYLEAGYLMGDPVYADFYEDGMPEPTIGYFDKDWNEHTGEKEAKDHSIKLIGCEYPEPIENTIVDKGVNLDHTAIAVLTAVAFLILVLGIVLVKKKEDVVYQKLDTIALIFNWVIGLFALPLLFSLGAEWDILMGKLDDLLAALMAPVTVLGICASVLLRRNGKSKFGMAAQFAGLLIFLYLITANLLVGFGGHLLFLVVGIAAGILLAARSTRIEGVVPTKLDRLALATNIALIPVYTILSLILMLMAAITGASIYAGPVQTVLTEVFACVIAASPVYCGVALGMSVRLRKKGKSLAGFFVQFAGFIGLVLTILIGLIPWVSMSIN